MVGVPLGAPLKGHHYLSCFPKEVRNVLLPVVKRLVAEKPIPLSVPGIANCVVGEISIGRAVCVEASQIIFISIAEILTV